MGLAACCSDSPATACYTDQGTPEYNDAILMEMMKDPSTDKRCTAATGFVCVSVALDQWIIVIHRLMVCVKLMHTY